MDKLADTLRAAGVDATPLEQIFQADMEAIHRLTVPAADAVATWERLRNLVPQTGCWPVLLGDDKDLENLQEHLKHVRYPRAARILEEAATIDAPEWFENRRLDELDALERGLEENLDSDEWARRVRLLSTEGRRRGMPEGPWPTAAEPARSYQILRYAMARETPPPQINVGLVSAAEGWQAPAFLRYGAWNECPSAAEHVALFRFWGEEYGAEVVGMAGAVVEMKVNRPPTDRDDALELAVQQYLYCREIVGLRVQTLQNLAASLLGGTVWHFWWA